MLKDVAAVKPLDDYRVWVRFEDGVEGIIDLKKELSFTGVFEPLRDHSYFAQVRVNPEIGTICWPNGADFDPLVLYARVMKQPIPEYQSRSTRVVG